MTLVLYSLTTVGLQYHYEISYRFCCTCQAVKDITAILAPSSGHSLKRQQYGSYYEELAPPEVSEGMQASWPSASDSLLSCADGSSSLLGAGAGRPRLRPVQTKAQSCEPSSFSYLFSVRSLVCLELHAG